MIHCDTLLQNATGIMTKCDSYFITKCVPEFLLQNATQLLQNATVLLQNATVISKCDVHYKLRQYTPRCFTLIDILIRIVTQILSLNSKHFHQKLYPNSLDIVGI